MSILTLTSAAAFVNVQHGTVVSPSGMPLPLTNVTIKGAAACSPRTQLTDASGVFSISCDAPLPPTATLTVWARQYLSTQLNASALDTIMLEARPMPGFPASDWRFDGWVVEAQTGAVPGTSPPVDFLAHPSAYRTPSGRIFVISTANSHAGPGWTQAYWQEPGEVRARAVGGQLIGPGHPVVEGTPFTARMLEVDGRLLMLVGMQSGDGTKLVSLLENKNVHDPSNPADWVAAEGDGHVHIDFAGAPTAKHEDYRLHAFDEAPADASGRRRRFWLFVIPDGVGPGRACGRMAFTSDALTGPFTYGGWLMSPTAPGGATGNVSSNCCSWPGDVLEAGSKRFFAAGWGNLYAAPINGSVRFERLGGDPRIAAPAPSPAWDDLHQIEFAFLQPPAGDADGRVRLYQASYSDQNGNPKATRADYGFKQAIGMYSFAWNR